MRKKAPRRASLDEVKIIREGEMTVSPPYPQSQVLGHELAGL